MEFKGDQGNWYIYGDGKYKLSIDSRIDDGRSFSGPKTLATVNTYGSQEEVLANGLLMSKASELLKQLHAITDMVVRKCNIGEDPELSELFMEVQKSVSLIQSATSI